VSGAGAAKTGGRFNRKGEPTLYLSLDIMTSFGECTQGLTQRLHPLTMCEYDVDCEPVADLRTEAGRVGHGVAYEDMSCGWMSYMRRGAEAPSWLVADQLKQQGFVGMLVPSFVPQATAENCNLVLWQWGVDLPTSVQVFDPTGRLPMDRASWKDR
jgi:RES domain-containing protein